MTTVRARIIEVEREHARPGGIAPIAAAQRKRRFIPDDIHFFMCHGVRSGSCSLSY